MKIIFYFERFARDISSRRRFSRETATNSSVIATMPTPANNLQRSGGENIPSESNAGYLSRRIKRQSAGREQLCQTTYQYITPQAALNSQGKKK